MLLYEMRKGKTMAPVPTTVTIQFPSKWMAKYFVDWVEDAFFEVMMGNEGIGVKEIKNAGVDTALNLVFVRDDQTLTCEFCGMVHAPQIA